MIINQIHKRERVERYHVLVRWVTSKRQEPKEVQNLGDNEDQFAEHYPPPESSICKPVAKHEASDPEEESGQRKFPCQKEGDAQVLKPKENIKDPHLTLRLQDLKSSDVCNNE